VQALDKSLCLKAMLLVAAVVFGPAACMAQAAATTETCELLSISGKGGAGQTGCGRVLLAVSFQQMVSKMDMRLRLDLGKLL
jgi:hypothetical protein